MSRRKPGKRFAAGIGLVLAVLLGVYLVTGREKLASWYERLKLLRDETAGETFGGHRYMMTPEPGNWYDAEQYARWLGGHLVKVDDAPEQDWLVETFGRSKPFWIGCTDRTVEGTWTWSDGQPLSFTNWFPGEPSNGDGWNDVPEHFAVMNNRNPGKWNDLGESASVSGIIELGD